MKSPQILTCTGWGPLDELAIEFAQLRDRAEFDLIEVAYADPPRGIAVARAAGVSRSHFARDDLRLLWLAAEVCDGRDLPSTLRVARRELRNAHFWDASQIKVNLGSMQWGEQTLAALASSWFFSEPLVRLRAQKLLHIVERQRHAEQLYRELIGTLSGEGRVLQPMTAAIPPARVPVVLVDRRKGVA